MMFNTTFADSTFPKNTAPKTTSPKIKKLTVNQITQHVGLQISGKIVSIRYLKTTNRYWVNVLRRDGKVHPLLFDANTGKHINQLSP
jgi:hypothetical protein